MPDDPRLVAAAGGGRVRSALRGLLRFSSLVLDAPLSLAIAWFVASLVTLLWAFGLNPVTFASPDEAVVRHAASLISEHGQPFLELPFADPEDLAHPRGWVTLGSRAVPSYAPFLLYVFGGLLRLGRPGLVILACLPCAAIAALVAGVAGLLPVGRRWLSLLSPALAFPSLYWLLRPWMNISALLACLCWAFLFSTFWLRDGKTRFLIAMALSVGMSAAVRPDYAAFLLICGLFFAIAARPPAYQRSILCFVFSGACALGINLLLNRMLTGHAFRAAYQVVIERRWSSEQAGTGSPWAALRTLLMPMGWPEPHMAAKLALKYFVKMGPVACLSLTQLALIPLLRAQRRVSIALTLAAVSFAVFFGYTHLHDDVFGGRGPAAWAEHSVPRYLTPLYLFAPLPLLLWLGRVRKWFPLLVLQVFAFGAAVSGLYEVAVRQPSSIAFLRKTTLEGDLALAVFGRRIPSDAMVYSATHDKVLWSRFRLGIIEDPELSAQSIQRAVTSGFAVYAIEPRFRRPFFVAFKGALSRRELTLVTVDPGRGLFRVERRAH